VRRALAGILIHGLGGIGKTTLAQKCQCGNARLSTTRPQ
jgi:hypothetical protein